MICRGYTCTVTPSIFDNAFAALPPSSSRNGVTILRRGLYAFTNRQRNKIKCLFWEDNGFVLYYKSLAEEKFRWPRPGDELMSLTGQQINWLLDGYDISLMQGHKKLHYEALF